MISKLSSHFRANNILFYGLLFGAVFFISGMLAPASLLAVLNEINQQLLSVFSTYYLVLGLFIVLACLVILFSPIGSKKLGAGKPSYSYFSWIALLYSTGMGSGLLLRAVQEPVYYFNNSPVSTANAAQTALQYTFFHWGFTPWAMYSLFGLLVAHNLYIKKAPNLLHAIVPSLNNRLLQFGAVLFIVLITITGVIASLGLGTAQLIGGLNYTFDTGLDTWFLLCSVLVMGSFATYSASTGITKMIKFLADFDFVFSIILMLFVAFFVKFNVLITQSFSAFYQYVIHFFEMSLAAGSYTAKGNFTQDWTVFYWAFWLAWVPFTGIFIARISKGRTIKEFLIATILVPALATMIWFSVFASSAFEIIHGGSSTEFDNVFTSLFVFLEHLPLHQVTFFLAGLLVAISIINSVDSAIFVLGMISDEGKENPSKSHKIIWGIIITATALGLTSLGTNELLNGISSLLIIMVLPFSFLYLYCIILFFKKNVFIKHGKTGSEKKEVN
ncbi:BCCT family transporter [Flavobacterium sp. ACN6]|uniref:BCCT family transporter n=1 Tax=Flavobacterium sp. ACN6 TaxID=1920426 RepID=UPI001143917E|nr:BCCT family transporter [Flavobacterium sp. ACN6]PBJ15877.1 Glycine betaine transporter OpuD [Flavobacterium sp. ACN6]